MAKRRKTRVAADSEITGSKKQAWQRVIVLPIAAKEGWNELTPGQYLHVKDHVKQLVGFGRKQFDSAIPNSSLRRVLGAENQRRCTRKEEYSGVLQVPPIRE